MLAEILILSTLVVAVTYPCCFLISRDDPLKNNFHHFHLGLPVFLGGVVTVFLLRQGVTMRSTVALLAWLASLFALSAYYWRKDYPDAGIIAGSSLVGFVAYLLVQNQLIMPHWKIAVLGILSGMILSASLYAMNLGHWYLNVHGLPISHLMRSVYVLGVLLLLRLLWDVVFLFTATLIYQGDVIKFFQFLGTMDGFLLIIALFFGTLFPLGGLYFVRGTLLVKSTQSATGILYVLLSAILIGEITYKYYLIKFGIVL